MGTLDVATLRGLVERGAIDTVVAAFPDMYGRLMGKRNVARFFLDEVVDHGLHACDYLLACDMEMDPVPGYALTGWDTGYGDVHAVPDLRTLRVLPWLERTAFVFADLVADDDGAPVAVAPRQVLAAQLARARAMELRVMGGSELEFYTFRDSYETAQRKHYHDLEPYGWYIEDYHILQGTKAEWLIRDIRNAMDAAGVPVEFSKGEWGPGQQEINLRYADVGETADRHTLYKHGAKEIAALRNVAVTFMAKWDARLAGSSCHLHASLWDLDGAASRCADAAAPHGMSDLFRRWLAGLLAHTRECALFYAPTVNSYKRYRAGSFAPTRIVWSRDNRTAAYRLVGRGASLRIENRLPGADVNPYLAYAAMLAAGLDGIERGLELPEPFAGNAYAAADLPAMPLGLAEAADEFERSAFARAAFGDAVVEHYVHAARTELRKFNEAVTCWERERYFERG